MYIEVVWANYRLSFIDRKMFSMHTRQTIPARKKTREIRALRRLDLIDRSLDIDETRAAQPFSEPKRHFFQLRFHFAKKRKLLAGPEGFEPSFSGSEGRCLNPDWATGPLQVTLFEL